jgi:hypothetical protein
VNLAHEFGAQFAAYLGGGAEGEALRSQREREACREHGQHGGERDPHVGERGALDHDSVDCPCKQRGRHDHEQTGGKAGGHGETKAAARGAGAAREPGIESLVQVR